MLPVVVLLTVVVLVVYCIYTYRQPQKKILVLMVKEDTPLYIDGVRAEVVSYNAWSRIEAISFPKGTINFEECSRENVVRVVEKWYAKGIRWFCGVLSSTTCTILKPFLEQHKECVLQSTYSTASSVKYIDNVYRMLNDMTDTKPYREWLMKHIIDNYMPDRILLLEQKNDVWSHDMSIEFEKIASAKGYLTDQGGISEDSMQLIKKHPKSLIICLSLNWELCLQQLQQAGVQGYNVYFGDTIAYRHDVDRFADFLKNNNLFASTSYPLTSGIAYITGQLGTKTVSPYISSLYWVYLDAMRWVLSNIDSPYNFVELMCMEKGMYYYNKYGDQADIRAVLLKAQLTDGNQIEWVTLSAAGYRQTFGSFLADYTVGKRKVDQKDDKTLLQSSIRR